MGKSLVDLGWRLQNKDRDGGEWVTIGVVVEALPVHERVLIECTPAGRAAFESGGLHSPISAGGRVGAGYNVDIDKPLPCSIAMIEQEPWCRFVQPVETEAP